MSLQIRLYNEWRGNYPNAVIEVNDNVGKALIEQNIGELYIKPKIKKVSIKQIDKAPKDKMMRSSRVTRKNK
jgi:hypothetical protein